MLGLGAGLVNLPGLGRRGLNPAVALLGNEPAGLAWDAVSGQIYIKDPTTPANNYLGDANGKLNYAAPSPKRIFERDGVLRSGTGLRCEYDPATGQPLGVRIESQRTNLLSESDFRNGIGDSIPKQNITASTFPRLPNNTGIAFSPDGTQAFAYKTTTYDVGVTYAFSCFVQVDDDLGPPLFGTGNTNDLQVIVQGATTGSTGLRVENLGSGLYRASIPWTVTVLSNGNTGILRNANNRQRPMRISGYQLEVGSFPSSYIPTTTAQATRAIDDIDLAPGLMQIGPDVTLIMDMVHYFEPATNRGFGPMFLRPLPATTIVAGLYNTARFISQIGGSQVGSFGGTLPAVGVRTCVATTMKSGEQRQAINGGIAPNTLLATLSSSELAASRLKMGGIMNGGMIADYHLKRCVVIPRFMSDAELQAWPV